MKPVYFQLSTNDAVVRLRSDLMLSVALATERVVWPELPRFISPDPVSGKLETPITWNRYLYCRNDPINYIDPDGRDAVLLVWRDYPAGGQENTGHAGVLLINPDNGLTKYYDYGRYDAENLGRVEHYSVPNVVMGEDGFPTQDSMNQVLDFISNESGTRDGVTYDLNAAYFKSEMFEEMNSFAGKRRSENDNPDRKPYTLLRNNCGHFATDVLHQDPSISRPWIRRPDPRGLINQYVNRADKVYEREY